MIPGIRAAGVRAGEAAWSPLGRASLCGWRWFCLDRAFRTLFPLCDLVVVLVLKALLEGREYQRLWLLWCGGCAVGGIVTRVESQCY